MFTALLFAAPIAFVPGLRSAHAQAQPQGGNEKEDESDEGGAGDEDDAAKPDPDQPAVTAGGNYSVANEPLEEVMRTLLEPDGGLELRLDWHADLTSGIEFKTHTFDLLAQYGVVPMNTIRLGFDIVAAAPDGVTKQKELHLEDEQAIVYDLLDVRLGIDVPFEPDAAVDITLGLPFKYRISSKIALLGLERIIAIHTKSVDDGTGNSSVPSPDLTFSLAGELQVIPQLVIIVRPQIFLPAASGDNKDLSVEAAVQYTISNQFDIGFRLILSQLTPPSTTLPSGAGALASSSALDAREFAFFIRGRLPTK